MLRSLESPRGDPDAQPAAPRPRRLTRLLRFARRHDHATAGLAFLVIASLWLLPLFGGRQLGENYMLYSAVPWRAAAPASSPLPARALANDIALEDQPWAVVARSQLASGHLPLWNPYEYGGMTYVGNMQSALFFPLTWLLLILPLGYAWGVVAIAKLVLAGLGTYALARALRAGPGGALLGGTVYLLSAPLIAWLQWPVGSEIALFPWLLLAVTRVARAPGRREIAGLGLAIAMLLFAGHIETTVTAVSAAGIYALTLIAAQTAGLRAKLRTGLVAVGGVLLGCVVAAVAIVPFLQAYGPSVTRTVNQSYGVFQHLPVLTALDYVLPHMFGDGKPRVYGDSFFNAVALYVAFPALLLSVVALGRRWRRPEILALLVMAIAGALAVFGLPPVSWVTKHVPPWSSIKIADRGTFIVALAASVLAAVGFSSLERRPLPVRRVARLAAGAGLVIVLGFVAARAGGDLTAPGTLQRNALLLTAFLLLATSVLLAALGRIGRRPVLALSLVLVVGSTAELHGLNVTLPPSRAYPAKPASISALQRQPWPFRIGALRPEGGPSVLPPNTFAMYGLESMEGYDFPLSRRWADLELRVLGFPALRIEVASASGTPSPAALTAYRMLNTRYYVAPPGFAAPRSSRFETLYRGRDATVFRDPAALPRAYVVPRVRPLSYDASLAELRSGRLNPRREALVPLGVAAPPAGATSGFRPARVERLAPDHVRVHLAPGSAGWLVLANSYSSTWEASADGHRVPVRPTDFAAMGVPVRAGTRTVDFRLNRTGIGVAAVLSLLGLVSLLVLAFAGGSERRRDPRAPARRRSRPRTHP